MASSPDFDPTKVGGLPPPPGVTPNFVNPYSQRDYLLVTVILTACMDANVYKVFDYQDPRMG
ncbi:MAG: hypothetical protein M1837_007392 [Sclerophora amabilis]|nr:MAG: hypothetical protein M1837_007392 [Sclerophora amabilis]